MQGRFIIAVGVAGVIKKGKNLEVFSLGDRVVFVSVALRTGHRGAHPHPHGGVHPVDDRGIAELLIIGAAFTVGHRIPVKGRGDELVLRGLREQIARNLLHRKLIKRFVVVEGPDHIIAEGPDSARRVIGIPGGVGITGQIQPEPGPVFAVGGRRQQAVDQPPVSLRRGIPDKGRDLLR